MMTTTKPLTAALARARAAEPVISSTPALIEAGEFDSASHRTYAPLIAQDRCDRLTISQERQRESTR